MRLTDLASLREAIGVRLAIAERAGRGRTAAAQQRADAVQRRLKAAFQLLREDGILIPTDINTPSAAHRGLPPVSIKRGQGVVVGGLVADRARAFASLMMWYVDGPVPGTATLILHRWVVAILRAHGIAAAWTGKPASPIRINLGEMLPGDHDAPIVMQRLAAIRH